MSGGPGFDPYAVLGVDVDADPIVIQLAYKARIRQHHPDVAGPEGAEAAKRLNVARDWLLDPKLRAQLSPPSPRRGGSRAGRGAATSTAVRTTGLRTTRGAAAFRRRDFDPFSFDFGPSSPRIRAVLRRITSLTRDERARVNYSLGDTRAVDFEPYRDYLDPQLWSRSQALRQAIAQVWEQGVDEEAPLVPPLGRLVPSGAIVANANAQWLLLGDFFKHELAGAATRGDHVIEAFAARCVLPWQASLDQARYGPHDAIVTAFLRTAATLPAEHAERLARSWSRHMGRDARGRRSKRVGPGVWLPVPAGYPEILKVSGYLAAVDASRIVPPAGLAERSHASFRFGLRLTAHVLALGGMTEVGIDYLRPWRDAIDVSPSALSQLRTWIPSG